MFLKQQFHLLQMPGLIQYNMDLFSIYILQWQKVSGIHTWQTNIEIKWPMQSAICVAAFIEYSKSIAVQWSVWMLS